MSLLDQCLAESRYPTPEEIIALYPALRITPRANIYLRDEAYLDPKKDPQWCACPVGVLLADHRGFPTRGTILANDYTANALTNLIGRTMPLSVFFRWGDWAEGLIAGFDGGLCAAASSAAKRAGHAAGKTVRVHFQSQGVAL